MPIYEYHCQHCDKRVEVLLRSSAAPPHCPHCGAVLQDRLFSAPHVHKGPAGQSSPTRGPGLVPRGPFGGAVARPAR